MADAPTPALAPAPAPAPAAPIISISDGELLGVQNQLNSLKQQVSQASNYTQLESSQDQVQVLIQEIERLSTSLLPGQAQLQAQLNVLGPVPLDENAQVTSAITTQRDALGEQKDKIDSQLKTLAALKISAAELITQIASIRRSLLEAEVTQQTSSILYPGFWSPLFALPIEDRQRFSALIEQLEATHRAAWQPDNAGSRPPCCCWPWSYGPWVETSPGGAWRGCAFIECLQAGCGAAPLRWRR